jgi:hypothetical protein
MRRIVPLILAAFLLSPAYASKDVEVQVKYLGQGVFQFGKKAYVYDALVDTLHTVYKDKPMDWVIVDMGATASQQDKAKVCQLRQSLLTKVIMFITVDKDKRELFCN